ncbi:hypothetical protein ACEQUB_03545 [Ralstonia syzygii]|nr:hypothetical protein LMG10661_03883 [Ralstonia syzygii subsp. syzygii]
MLIDQHTAQTKAGGTTLPEAQFNQTAPDLGVWPSEHGVWKFDLGAKE